MLKPHLHEQVLSGIFLCVNVFMWEFLFASEDEKNCPILYDVQIGQSTRAIENCRTKIALADAPFKNHIAHVTTHFIYYLPPNHCLCELI